MSRALQTARLPRNYGLCDFFAGQMLYSRRGRLLSPCISTKNLAEGCSKIGELQQKVASAVQGTLYAVRSISNGAIVGPSAFRTSPISEQFNRGSKLQPHLGLVSLYKVLHSRRLTYLRRPAKIAINKKETQARERNDVPFLFCAAFCCKYIRCHF